MLPVDAPEWEPLLNLAPDHVVDFMWMGTIQLADGTRLQAYKHHWTRDYFIYPRMGERSSTSLKRATKRSTRPGC
ncbi:MAG TPA: hypothetical protein VFM51_02980 [Solirubrobacterales bacterium]|nr:hypothetical protein [Solirubrobacterales bacterium]